MSSCVTIRSILQAPVGSVQEREWEKLFLEEGQAFDSADQKDTEYRTDFTGNLLFNYGTTEHHPSQSTIIVRDDCHELLFK